MLVTIYNDIMSDLFGKLKHMHGLFDEKSKNESWAKYIEKAIQNTIEAMHEIQKNTTTHGAGERYYDNLPLEDIKECERIVSERLAKRNKMKILEKHVA